MSDRYPGYDVLSKRDTPSWNEQTRQVIDARLAIAPDSPKFLEEEPWRVLRAVCDRIVPQPTNRTQPVPLAAMVDAKLAKDERDGYRNARLPPPREAWTRGLAALEAEAHARFGCDFADLDAHQQDALLTDVQNGTTQSDEWGDMPPALFFTDRVMHDIISSYYAHPHSWNEIGFGGPASPRGYVRLNYDRRDPWEAAEAKPGHEDEAFEENRRVGR